MKTFFALLALAAVAAAESDAQLGYFPHHAGFGYAHAPVHAPMVAEEPSGFFYHVQTYDKKPVVQAPLTAYAAVPHANYDYNLAAAPLAYNHGAWNPYWNNGAWAGHWGANWAGLNWGAHPYHAGYPYYHGMPMVAAPAEEKQE